MWTRPRGSSTGREERLLFLNLKILIIFQVSHHPSTLDLQKVLIPEDVPVKQVHCLLDTSFILLENGSLYSFGLGTDGQLGTGLANFNPIPTKLSLPPMKLIGGSTDTAMAVSEEGQLFIWGQNEYGQLGELIGEPQISLPIPCPFVFDAPVRSAHSTATSCIVSTMAGSVFTWGSMVLGQGPVVTKTDRPMKLSSNFFATGKGDSGRVS